MLLLLTLLFVLGNTVAHAAGPFDPVGFGDLFVQPDLAAGHDKTLYEDIPSSAYKFDTDLGLTEVPEKVLGFIANFLMFILHSIIQGAIVVFWVLSSFAGWTSLTDTVTPALTALSTEFAGWLLPSALAIGGVTAYWQRRNAGDAVGQIVWVAVSTAIALTMTYSAATWVGAVNGLRQIGTTAVASASAGVIGETASPFAGPAASYGGPVQDTNLRKIGDSVWRAYVVTPWCAAEFGSLAACSEWGYELLQQGDLDSRKRFLESKHGEMGEAAKEWVKGKSPADRLGIVAVSLLIGSVFAALVITLAVAAGLALASAILLLFIGSIFVMMWCIPGTPRKWGLAWLETLVGFVIQSVLATLILTAVLSLTSASFGLIDSYGWGIAAVIALTLGGAAFGMRRTLNQILGFNVSSGGGTGLMGSMVMRAGMNAMRGLGQGARRVGQRARRAMNRRQTNSPHDNGPRQQGRGNTTAASNTPRYNQNRGRISVQTANHGRNLSSTGSASTARTGTGSKNSSADAPQAMRPTTPKRNPVARPHQMRTGHHAGAAESKGGQPRAAQPGQGEAAEAATAPTPTKPRTIGAARLRDNPAPRQRIRSDAPKAPKEGRWTRKQRPSKRTT